MTYGALFIRAKNRIKHLLTMNYKVQLSKSVFYSFALWNEDRLGVDFYESHTLEELGHPVDGELIHYGATRTYEMKKVLKKCDLKPSDAILDFGCGKGLSLLNFHKAGFKKLTGVELNFGLCEIAKDNFKKLNIKGIEILNRDATSLEKELDSYNYFFFYNPFTGSVFAKVLDNVLESLKRHPRHVTIIYNYPVEREQILKSGIFKMIHSYVPFFFGGEIAVFRNQV